MTSISIERPIFLRTRTKRFGEQFLSFGAPPQASPQKTGQVQGQQKAKRKRRVLWAIVAVVLVAVVIFTVFWSGLFQSEPQHNLTSFNEHLVIYSHTASGTQTVTYLINLNNLGGEHPAGHQLVIEVPYHYTGTGTENITSMTCNTPNFSLARVSPSLPVTLPNTPTIEAGAITLRITFDTPSAPYTGPFDFTVYYDQYP